MPDLTGTIVIYLTRWLRCTRQNYCSGTGHVNSTPRFIINQLTHVTNARISRKSSSERLRQNTSRLLGSDRGAGSSVEGSVPREMRRPEACKVFVIYNSK